MDGQLQYLINMIKKIIKNKLPRFYKKAVKIKNNLTPFYKKSYSQFGEDMVLNSFIIEENIQKGFFIDIGAYHPKKYSNTYFFYKKGWSGINIDANPGSMRKFNKHRKRDINIEVAIDNTEKEKEIFLYEDGAYNTLSKNRVNILKNEEIKIKEIKKIKTQKLTNILDKYLSNNQLIDFMSIDVEGLDLEILKSNDWNKYKPKFILIELHFNNVKEIFNNNVYKFLIEKNYKLISIIRITLLFKYKYE
ncbi:FkbM family methyltransferase [bacterium]|nr:FkbM family methyltransferase [bacterium]